MYLSAEIEIDEEIFTAEGEMSAGEASDHEYCGSPPELYFLKVTDENGCDVTRDLDYEKLETIEYELHQIYDNR